ncbi:MAG: hypothetical protein JNM52_11000 [Betaproteobacteria bacterium]|nr:hypothetical protein [Betaproteobacteria bacterium]
MRWLAIALAVGVFARHAGAGWLAQYLPIPQAGIFYALGGLWEVVLCGALLSLLWCLRSAGVFYRLAVGCCLIGILEGGQMAACRLAVKTIGAVPPGMNLCDYVTGLPVGHTLLAVYFVILCWAVGPNYAKRTHGHH